MAGTEKFNPGGYRYIPGVFQYSGGVAAEPGFRIGRVTFRRPLPLMQGFQRAAAIMKAAGRPLTAFCACELRSPNQFTEQQFKDFNEIYVGTLKDWGIFDGATNPVARSNVCPEIDKPAEPSLYAFAYTLEDAGAAPSFVAAGSGEAAEGKGNYKDHVVAYKDLSPSGLAQKANWVVGEMQRRMGLLGFGWNDTTAVQVYTVHDIHPLLPTLFVPSGAARHGLIWHHCRPPIVDLEFEMDVRGLVTEVMSD